MLSKSDILRREQELGHRNMAARRAFNFRLGGGGRISDRRKEELEEKQKELAYEYTEKLEREEDKKRDVKFIKRSKDPPKQIRDDFMKHQLKRLKDSKYDGLKEVASGIKKSKDGKIVDVVSSTPEKRMPHVAKVLKEIQKKEAEYENATKKRKRRKKKKKVK